MAVGQTIRVVVPAAFAVALVPIAAFGFTWAAITTAALAYPVLFAFSFVDQWLRGHARDHR